MDGSQTSLVPEQQAATSEVGAEQLLSDKLEAKAAPAVPEAAGSQPKRDDGVASAQTQVASVTPDDQGDDQTATTTTAAPSQPAPLTAADVDVIEPEWVKKAEEAVAKNRQDPRAEEAAVEAIQIDYLKKRYNLDVKPGDEKP